MNREEYFQFHADFCRKMQEITQKKNADYTGGADDPFANFRVVEKLGVCSVEQGFLTRMSDKFIRMVNLSDGRDPKVTDESLEDSILDLANYCALFAGFLRGKRVAWEALQAEIYAPPGDKYYEIIATSRSGDITVETWSDPLTAAMRLEKVRLDWPTFALRIEEREYGHGGDDEHTDVA
jgi:hypothetical protein